MNRLSELVKEGKRQRDEREGGRVDGMKGRSAMQMSRLFYCIAGTVRGTG